MASKLAKRRYYRSGTKICILCGYSGPLHSHHINGRNIPKWDANWNVLECCPNCHDKIHNSSIIIHEWLSTTQGICLLWEQNQQQYLTTEDGTTTNL